MNVYGKIRGLEAWNIVGVETEEPESEGTYEIGDCILIKQPDDNSAPAAIYQRTSSYEKDGTTKYYKKLCNLLWDIKNVSVNIPNNNEDSGTISFDGNEYTIILNLGSLKKANEIRDYIIGGSSHEKCLGALFAGYYNDKTSVIYNVNKKDVGLKMTGEGLVSIEPTGADKEISNELKISTVWGTF